MFKHEMLESILFRAAVFAAHEHRVIGHHLEQPASEGAAAEKHAACVDALVVLSNEDVDFLNAEVGRRVDVGRVLFQLAVEDRGVAHQAAL